MPEVEEAWEVVVVGGGPGGAAVAARLARLGHSVLLLDREAFPRPKPCGECLNPSAVAALARLGALGAVAAAGPATLHGWRIHAPDGARFEGRFPAGVAGLALPRAVLDRLLLDHARGCGVAVRTGVRVTGLLREGGHVVGVAATAADGTRLRLRARLTVGADGLRSVVSRRLGLIRRPPRLRKLALTAHVRGLPPAAAIGSMHVTRFGCVGVADVGDGTSNVTVVAAGAAAREVAGDRAGFFDAALRALPDAGSAARVEEVLATGPFDWPVRSAVADGALLVGDAAGYYDPFTGQGIFRALRGAELAAEVASRALRADDLSAAALAPYEAARRRAFTPGVRFQALLEQVVGRPRLLGAAARLLERRPAVADALVAVAGDLAPVRSLLRPRLLGRLLR